jgi:hypothetical protein
MAGFAMKATERNPEFVDDAIEVGGWMALGKKGSGLGNRTWQCEYDSISWTCVKRGRNGNVMALWKMGGATCEEGFRVQVSGVRI